MGDLTWLWENGRPMGICQNVWATAMPYREMACVGGRRIAWGAAKTYGKCHGIWEPAPAYGKAARPYGEPAPMADFAHFCNSRERRQGMGAARLDGAATWLAASCRGTGALGECSGMAVTQL